MFFAQCAGCGFISRRCVTEAQALADLETSTSHASFHYDWVTWQPIRIAEATILEDGTGSDV